MRRFLATLIGLSLIFTATIGALQWVKYKNFGYNGLDLGIYTQTVWSLAQGHGFANSIHDPSYLGDHLELILVPIAGLYRLFPHPLTLLWLQTLMIALTGIGFAFLARRYISSRWALLAAALFYCHPLVYNPALYEFHGLTLALPFLIAAILAYERRWWWLWALLLLITCLIREDLPLIAISWSVLAAWDRAPWRWWASVGVFGLAWFFIAHHFIATANPLDAYKYTAFVAWLGNQPIDMLLFPFKQPLVFLSHVFSLNNWATALYLLAGFGFLPLLRPRYLIPAGLSFAQILLIGSSPDSVIRLHYVIPFIPFLAWTALIVLRDTGRHQIFIKMDREIITVLVIILGFVGPIYAQFMYGPAEWPWSPSKYAESTPGAALTQSLSGVNSADRVLTTFNLLPNLANREHLYSLNYVYLGRRQYSETRYTVPGPIDVAIIDWQQLYDYQFFYKETLFEGLTGEERITKLLKENQLIPAAAYGSVVVYRRGGNLKPSLTINSGAGQPASSTLSVTDATAKLINHQATVELNWLAGAAITSPISIHFDFYDKSGQRWSTTRLLGEGGAPATTWAGGSSWQTNYQFWLPENYEPTRVDYAWLNIDGRYRLNRWRGFQPRVSAATELGRGAIEVRN